MSACEACWRLASLRALTRGGHTADHYRDLLAETDAAGIKHEDPVCATPDAADRTEGEQQ